MMAEGIWKLEIFTTRSKITMNSTTRFSTEQQKERIGGEFARSNSQSIPAQTKDYNLGLTKKRVRVFLYLNEVFGQPNSKEIHVLSGT